jgi:hypothetical protein
MKRLWWKTPRGRETRSACGTIRQRSSKMEFDEQSDSGFPVALGAPISARWVRLITPRGGAAFAWRVHGKRHNDNQAHKAEVQEWENEGGNPAPSSEAPDTLVTAGSA